MKSKIINLISKTGWILPIATLLMAGACKKNNYLGYTPGTGAPTITSVHTLGKQDTTIRYDTVISYNALGNQTSTLKQKPFPYNPFDSVTTEGNLGNYVIIYGTNLGSATSITFNGTAGFLNRAWNTDKSIIVAIPGNAPATGPRATGNLIVTTTHGAVTYKFGIIAPPPIVSSYSSFDFTSTGGYQMTLKGVGFASVTNVTVQDTVTGQTGTASANIVSQNDSVMVLSFASSTISRGILSFAYTAGGAAATAKGAQELVNIDNAYQIFAYGAVAPGWGSWSFDNVSVSNKQAITAATSYDMQFSAGGFKVDGWRNGGGTPTDGIPYNASYTYLVFYVYGGVQSETLYILWGDEGFGNGGGNAINAQTIIPNQWNYFKIPISTLLWNTSTTNWAANSSSHLVTLGFFMKSNSSVTEQLYFDDAVLVK
jgi:hypothetical protein